MPTDHPRPDIGPYEVVRLLGRGGFGTVYLCQQNAPVRREVAVKVLNPGMDFQEIRSRFRVERETLTLMQHPGIAMLLDAGVTEDEEPYFAMEYVPGIPINKFVTEHPLDLRGRLDLFRSVCAAVAHAHNKGVIHRDLTANNVLVQMIDGRPSPKIIDFGIAKSMGESLAVSMHTSEGQAMGTPTYMSPEQALGQIDKIDTRTDIYALGVQLYFLLTGTLPISDEQLREVGAGILKLICEEEAELPSRRVAQLQKSAISSGMLRSDLDWIASKALAKDRDRRYASVAELSEDVRRFLDHEPVLAGPPTTWYRVQKFVRRYRGAVTAATLVLLSLVAGLIVSIILFFQSSANAEEAEENLGRFNHLADVVQLETLREEFDGLGAGRPENVRALQSWVDRADGLLSRVPELQDVLEEARDFAGPEARAHRFLKRELGGYLVELNEYLLDDRGKLEEVRERLEWAREVEQVTIEDQRAAWEQAAARVAADPLFAGWTLRPQLGLVPLGRDHVSGLEEFLLLRSGEAPRRDPATRRFVVEEATGIVFVLIPGAVYQLGAQYDDPDRPGYDPEAKWDQAANEKIGEKWRLYVFDVTLEPYLLSKYEVTQAQWARLSRGHRPSGVQGEAYNPYHVTDCNPVDSVSWAEARKVLGRYGMDLPTEAQWEFACRGGQPGRWHCGDTESSLDGFANLADVTARDARVDWENLVDVTLEDGFVFSAPVGSFEPNGYGLFDMHGNVFEFCLEHYGPYEPGGFEGPRAERVSPLPEGDVSHVIRGGAYYWRARSAAVTYRWHTPEGSANSDLGIRPVMLWSDSRP